MCILTFMPAGITANIEHLRNGAWNNDDGHGFAVHCGNKIITGHGMDFEKVLDQFLEVRKRNHGHALFHSRITTHGKTNVDNCHPFRVGGDPRTVVGHNGVLPIQVPKDDDRSDTRIFADTYLPSIGGVYALDEPDVFQSLSKWASGSKLVVLTADEWAQKDFYIINENLGHWDSDGVWWSNNTYQYRWQSYGTYGSGWSTSVTRTAKTPKDDSYYESLFSDDTEEEYWNLYEVTCPSCGVGEIYDFDTDDPIDCMTCGDCLWCQHPTDKCICYDAAVEMCVTPEMRKLKSNEVRDWVYCLGEYSNAR